MPEIVEFPLVSAEILPRIPVTLMNADYIVTANALLDSGSSINVLPYHLGLQLGASWQEQTIPIQLAGNLAKVEARGLFVNLQIGNLEPVRLAFAWAKMDKIPLILGQVNFFQEFDVCFEQSRQVIKITRF